MYSNKTDRELIELLDKYQTLTFQSQLVLKNELSLRNIQEPTSHLNNTINHEISKIDNLEYLNDLGFNLEKVGNSIKVTRTTKAIIIDIIAIIFGLIFCVIGFFGITSLIGAFYTESAVSVFSLIINIGMVAIGYTGIKLLSGIKRLFDYSGFELLNINGLVILKKRFDLKIIEIQRDISHLTLTEQTENLVLKLGDYEILKTNAKNLVHNMTIKALTSKLKTKIN